MATFEQCEKAVRVRLKTRQDAYEFLSLFGKSAVDTNLADDAEFIDKNIAWIMGWATNNGMLDTMGRKLGFPSDAESNRLDTLGANKRSRLAMVIAALALLVSTLVAIFK